MKRILDDGFGERLQHALGAANKSEIASILGVGNSAVTNYMRGERLPEIEKLIDLSRKKKFSLHWLLTGEDRADTDPLQFLAENQRNVLAVISDLKAVAPEELVRQWVNAGIGARIAQLTAEINRLRPNEIDELRALFQVIGRDVDARDEITAKAG